MHEQYTCPNCGISALNFNPKCTRHVSPLLGKPQPPPAQSESRSTVERIKLRNLREGAEAFCRIVEISLTDIIESRKNPAFMQSRRVLVHILYTKCETKERITQQMIGRLLRKTNSTIINDLAAFTFMYDNNPDLQKRADEVTQKLREYIALRNKVPA